jgi:mannose-6-phosphate isomerase-like protein (cupin superfamily)
MHFTLCKGQPSPVGQRTRHRPLPGSPRRGSGEKAIGLTALNWPWTESESAWPERQHINQLGFISEGGGTMKGFVDDIESSAKKNEEFRRVVYTAKHCQLVLMALKPKEEIGAEVHKLDQFFRVEEGTGEAVLDGVRTSIRAGFAVVVPAGTNHNIINTGNVPLKLYTLYAPPNHRDGVVHHTRVDAEADNEHFDGKTTE